MVFFVLPPNPKWKGGDIMNDKVTFDMYVKKAIKNKIIDFSIKEKRDMPFNSININDALLSVNDDSVSFCSSDIIDELFFENGKLARAFLELNPEEKRLLELTIIKGYADREIAKITAVKENTITRRKNRALNKLKDFLGGC